jgi:hypothetical protein
MGKVAVFSNSIGSSLYDPNFMMAENFSAEIGIPVIKHNSKV